MNVISLASNSAGIGFAEVLEFIKHVLNILAIVLTPIVALIINAIAALILASVARKKGYSPVGAFFFCLFFGIAGYIYVAALPDMVKRRQMETIINLIQSEKKDDDVREDTAKDTGTEDEKEAEEPEEEIHAEL